MVLVHEFGHFLACKLCGVRVEVFAIGFGKRLFGFIHNGTDYALNLLPLGGFVKMAGEMGPTGGDQVLTNDPGELQNHPRWQRTIIAVAGPLANFILAFVLMTAVYMAHNEVEQYISQPVTADFITPGSAVAKTGIAPGDRVLRFDTLENPTWEDLEIRAHLTLNHTTAFSYIHDGHRVDTTLYVQDKGNPEDFEFASLGLIPQVQPGPITIQSLSAKTNTPAERAGLQPGDEILAVNGLQLHSVQAFSAYLQSEDGKPALLNVLRPGQPAPLTVAVTPELADSPTGSKTYQIGFTAALPPTTVEHYSLPKAAAASWTFNRKNSLLVVEIIHRLFTRQVSVKSFSSPIGIGVVVHQAFETESWVTVVGTMALISLQLGIFNLLPIPILDGGMIAFLFIESLMRRDINQQLKERVYQVAFVCIVLFAAIVIFNDITKYLPTHIHPS